MPYDETLLDEYADVIFQRLEDFNDYTLEVIGRHIKEIGSLSAYDQQALKNMADISGDMKKITAKLAEITKMNIEDIEKIYTQVVSDGLNTYKPLYDFKGIKFTPFQNNEIAKRLVRQFAMITDGEMINLTRTKALGFDKLGIVGGKVGVVGSYSLSEGLERVLGEAVTAVKAGTTDFHTAMRKTIGELGGSGVKVIYGSGVNRSISAAVRQNVLWGVKKSIDLYDDELAKELELDGFEVDAHPGCRPTHEFMQGKMYAIGKGKTVNGTYYPSGDEALKALSDYGCLHYKTGVLLGVSSPRYTKEELEKIQAETKEIIEFDGKKHTLYEWKQVQRRMERQTRNEMSVSKLYKASGDNIAAKQHKERAMAYLNKYDGLVKGVPGLEDRRDRMRVFEGSVSSHKGKTIDKITSDFAAKKLTNGGKGGIIMMQGDKNTLINSIDSPIEQRNTAKGNPNAILIFDRPLNNRQQKLLTVLTDYDSQTLVRKKDINMKDLSAMTAVTGDEFAMFTKGNNRLIVRGNATQVNIDVNKATELRKQGYKWSGHTHPGVGINITMPSTGDKDILKAFQQETSVIYDSKGGFRTFEKE